MQQPAKQPVLNTGQQQECQQPCCVECAKPNPTAGTVRHQSQPRSGVLPRKTQYANNE